MMKFRVSRPRILFLHSLHPHPHHELSLRRAIGTEAVRHVIPNNRRLTVSLITGCVLLACFLFSLLVPLYMAFALWVSVVGCCVWCGAVIGLWILGSRVNVALLLRDARQRAEDVMKEFRPNVIVASNYGAVVALSMTTSSMIPIVLLTPAQDVYARQLFLNPKRFTLREFPYALVCHGAADTTIPFEDTLRLCNTVEEERCHLISLDSADPSLEHVMTDEEMRDILLFTFHEGWISALMMTSTTLIRPPGTNTMPRRPLDISLLNLPDTLSFATVALHRIRQRPGHHKRHHADDITHVPPSATSVGGEDILATCLAETASSEEGVTTPDDTESVVRGDDDDGDGDGDDEGVLPIHIARAAPPRSRHEDDGTSQSSSNNTIGQSTSSPRTERDGDGNVNVDAVHVAIRD